ncbi:MAG: hypothetical protein J5I47_09985 [Vicingus serpentipes]|nr:hypothetical protein [Vicingus serpentipes]
MSNQLSYQLFELIKTLSKSEKRYFKLYAKRNLTEKELVFIQLFDVIDKMDQYEEKKITQKFPTLQGSLISNHKANLYEKLLMSLRLLKHSTPGIRVKELISFSDVLLQKGLHFQSLNQLQKAKKLAGTYHLNILKLEIIEFEKQIEASYITRSHQQRAKELSDESNQIRELIKTEGKWSNLALKMYDYYLKFGHIKNKNDLSQITAFFESRLPGETVYELSFYGKIYKSQSYVWFHYITQNFVECYKHSLNWINTFNDVPAMKINEVDLYMKGLHNCLSALFYCDDAIRFKRNLELLEKFIANNQSSFNNNQKILAFIYFETAKLNLFFLEGKFTEGAKYTIELAEKLKIYEKHIDISRVLTFNYKIACLKFGSDDYKGAIKHLNFIINHPELSLREDIQSFARILNLIAHYELGNDELLEYQVKSTYKFLLKLEDMGKVQTAVFEFLKKSVDVNEEQLTPSFIELKNKLDSILEDEHERRPTLYLDIISWLESKINNCSVEQVIRQKKLANMNK